MVPGFAGNTTVALPLDCTYDFEVAAAKYLHALRDGALPLQFLFSGTIFVKSERGFSVQQVPWDCEYRYDMPVAVWRAADRAALSEHRLGAAESRNHRGAGHLQVGARAARPRPRGHLAAGRRTGDGAMTSSWDRARAVADAVLYEGYLLYPYRGTSSKNQSRWQFGVLGPPGRGGRGPGRGRHPGGAVPGRRGARRSPWWCGSCSCSTAGPSAKSPTAASNPSTS